MIIPTPVLIWSTTATLFSLLFGYLFTRKFYHYFYTPIREFVTELHQAKTQTPSMGGLFFVAAFIFTLLLLGPWSDVRLWVCILVTAGFGLIGFWDDWSKIVYKKGISERRKFTAQIAVAAIALILWYWVLPASEAIFYIPFIPSWSFHIGWLIVPWGIWILLSTTNGVNLTDGIDGLAGSLVAINTAVFGIIAYANGDLLLGCIAAAFTGVLAGFLWFNSYPAKVFMGDVGSLACGGFLGMLALMSHRELLLPVVGMIFVIEVLSVMAQVTYFKRTGKRLLKMAPLHHHFELSEVPETRITARAILITLLLGLISLGL